MLTGMGKLEKLLLNDNVITTILDSTFEGDIAKTLKTITLSDNQLTPTLSLTFNTLEALTDLDVSVNKLYWIDEEMINWDVPLTKFDVSGNPWECQCRNAWLINRPVVNDSLSDPTTLT